MTRAYASPAAREAAAKRFADDTQHHRMTVMLDQGLYRHLRFVRPGRSEYWFTLTAYPGALVVDGDMGTWVFRRLPDMFEFFRTDSGRINPGYWAEKLTAMPEGGYAEYSQPLVKGLIWRTALDGLRRARAAGADWGAVGDAIEQFKDLRARCAESDPIAAMYEFKAEVPVGPRPPRTLRGLLQDPPKAHQIQFQEPWDHTLHEYRSGFLWILHAIVWGIQQYDAYLEAMKPAEAGV